MRVERLPLSIVWRLVITLLCVDGVGSASAADSPVVHEYTANRIRFTFSERDAARVDVLIACDVDAVAIGETVKHDLAHMREYLASMRDSLPDVEIRATSLYGSTLTPAAILGHYDQIQANAYDVLLFYYSGHGVTDTANVIGKPPENALLLDSHVLKLHRGSIYRREIRERMQAKQPKLVVMLTDCCSNRDKIVLPGKGISSSALHRVIGTAEPMGYSVDTFRSLFLRCNGCIDWSAAQIPTHAVKNGLVSEVGAGETAACNDVDGGVFTYTFLRMMALPPRELSNGSRYPESPLVDWMQLFGKLQWATYYYRLGLDGSVLTGVDRQNDDAVVQRLLNLTARERQLGSQRPFYFEMRGEHVPAPAAGANRSIRERLQELPPRSKSTPRNRPSGSPSSR